MPRLPPSLRYQACKISPYLATLLPACRDLASARNELRWIRQHVESGHARGTFRHEVRKLCQRRGKGVPLQYVLGSQPFGPLDIKCRPGVLIPRPETEAYTLHLAELLSAAGRQVGNLNVVDFCTGTGCIALLLCASLRSSSPQLQVIGVDVSRKAVHLAQENLECAIEDGRISPTSDVRFIKADIFDDTSIQDLATQSCHVLISNPPYVSKDVYASVHGHLARSVKKYEPELALVPSDSLPTYPGVSHEDVFYARLLDIAAILSPPIILFEIGDENQAVRVATLAARHAYTKNAEIELWGDWPNIAGPGDEVERGELRLEQQRSPRISIRGSGNVRSVFIRAPALDA